MEKWKPDVRVNSDVNYRMTGSTYQYVNLEIHLSLDSFSDKTPLNVCLILRPGRGALGRAISASCFLRYVVMTLAHSTLYCVGL